ncbi:unnamed protein product [Spodoptera exigua]|nr:unnamed protein product [Spodoptera exigua]
MIICSLAQNDPVYPFLLRRESEQSIGSGMVLLESGDELPADRRPTLRVAGDCRSIPKAQRVVYCSGRDMRRIVFSRALLALHCFTERGHGFLVPISVCP